MQNRIYYVSNCLISDVSWLLHMNVISPYSASIWAIAGVKLGVTTVHAGENVLSGLSLPLFLLAWTETRELRVWLSSECLVSVHKALSVIPCTVLAPIPPKIYVFENSSMIQLQLLNKTKFLLLFPQFYAMFT